MNRERVLTMCGKRPLTVSFATAPHLAEQGERSRLDACGVTITVYSVTPLVGGCPNTRCKVDHG